METIIGLGEALKLNTKSEKRKVVGYYLKKKSEKRFQALFTLRYSLFTRI
jgi:hypothetical protein